MQFTKTKRNLMSMRLLAKHVGGIMSGKAFIYRNERESLNDIYAISQATSRMKSSFRILLFES